MKIQAEIKPSIEEKEHRMLGWFAATESMKQMVRKKNAEIDAKRSLADNIAAMEREMDLLDAEMDAKTEAYNRSRLRCVIL
jgi:hypothetical protein